MECNIPKYRKLSVGFNDWCGHQAQRAGWWMFIINFNNSASEAIQLERVSMLVSDKGNEMRESIYDNICREQDSNYKYK